MRRRIAMGLAAAALLVAGSLSTGIGAVGAGAASTAGAPAGHVGGNPAGGRAHHGGPTGHVAGGGVAPRTVQPGPWSIAPTPNVSTHNWLNRDSCTSSAFCMAVGVDDSGSYRQTLIERWNGAAWTVVPSPNTSPTVNDDLVGVSCVTSSFCVAVGYSYVSGGYDRSLVETWNGSTWSIAQSPNTALTVSNQLFGVSCASASFCAAAGETQAAGGRQTLAMVWSGSSWAIQTTPDPSSTDFYFNNITCRSASWCLGVGSADVAGIYDTLVVKWDGSTWSVVPSPTPSGPGAYLDAVSCPSTTFCSAVGYTAYSSRYTVTTPVIEQWNGTSWSQVASPAVAGSFGDELWAVSCTGPTFCSTVGYNFTDSTQHTYVTEGLVWNGTTWSQQPPQNPAVDTPGNDYAELYGVSCVAGQSCVAVGDAYPGNGKNDQTLAESQSIAPPGYRFVASDGGVFSFGGASFNGSAGSLHLNKPVVGMAATPDGGGYWLVASDGGIFSYGDATFHGSAGSLHLNQPIVGMASTPDGGGYWLVAADGGIFAYGDATFHGSAGSLHLNKPIVGMASTPSGQGYWLVASDGGIFAFGDAAFHGSAGSLHLNKPVVGMASTPSGQGYWLVASDGGVFSYGDAVFHGSTGNLHLNQPIVGMSA